LGIGVAMQPIFTPGPGIYGLPHFVPVQILTSHSALVLAGVYMTTIEGMRPTWESLLRVFVFTNLYAAVVFLINLKLGSNYLFLMRKPPSASLMDYLGPWPWYLISLEVVALAVFLILYLPFVIKDWRGREASAGL
jgi:hypothetical integral membrane protein (TIGR02206 family)